MRLIGLAVVLGLSLVLASLDSEAQPPRKVPRIGFLGAVTPEDLPHLENAFQEGLREPGARRGDGLDQLGKTWWLDFTHMGRGEKG